MGPGTETIGTGFARAGSRSAFIVPMRTGNRARRDPAEGREASRIENRWPDTWEGALDPTNLSTNRQRIANLAGTKRGTALYSLQLELARCEYIARRENVIAVGNSGTGKTHISLGLGLAAQKGLSVGFTTAAALVHELIEARDDKRLLRLQRQLAAYKLLIIDELGYVPLSTTGAELLFEVFSQRYERGSTIVTSNLPFDEWTGVFGSERLTGALLDRLTHHVHILEMNGDSYRLKQSKQRQRPGVTRPAVSLPQGSLRGRSGARHARGAPSVMHFYSGPPVHILSGIDTSRGR